MSKEIYVQQSESGHWYSVADDGTVAARYEAGLRIARKENLYISPTTLWKAVRANGALAVWLKSRLFSAFFSTVRYNGESDKDFAKRLDEIASSKGAEAANYGTKVHDAIEHYPQLPSDSSLTWAYEQYAKWHEQNITSVLSSEKMIADRRIGVAGRCDRIAIHKDYGEVVIDIKTQDVKEGKKPQAWDSWAPQLAFYAMAEKANGGLSCTPYCINLVIDSNNNYQITPFVWTPSQVEAAHLEFLATAWLWFNEKNYWPVGKWQPTFNI